MPRPHLAFSTLAALVLALPSVDVSAQESVAQEQQVLAEFGLTRDEAQGLIG
jgi:hypothetical protein